MRFSNLDRLGKRISVDLKTDSRGFLDRRCPSCGGFFKMRGSRPMIFTPNATPHRPRIVIGPTKMTFCPYCGTGQKSQSFATEQQVEYARQVVAAKAHEAIAKDLKEITSKWNRDLRQTPLLRGMTIGVKPTTIRRIPIFYPRVSLEEEIQCEACNTRFVVNRVYAYCPHCGIHNNWSIFASNIAYVGKQLAEHYEKADSADIKRRILEDALENIVSAFDGWGRLEVERRGKRLQDTSTLERLSFQNLVGAEKKLDKAFRIKLSNLVPTEDWKSITQGFSKRHLIAHSNGVVDKKFLEEVPDSDERLGRRVSLGIDEVKAVAALVDKLARALVKAFEA